MVTVQEAIRIADCLDDLYADIVSPEICISYHDDMVTVRKGNEIISETFVKCLTPAELIRMIAVDLDGEK